MLAFSVALPGQDPLPAGMADALAAINKALAQPGAEALPALFSAGADVRIGDGKLVPPSALAEVLANRPQWSEVTAPRIENSLVRLAAPDVAVVDGDWVQYGSTIMRRAQPVFLLLKKEGADWRIVSLRLGAWCFPDGMPRPQ